MRLYIAEKPSMGREIAKCLKGPVISHDGYLSTRDGIVTWLFGHILRQAEPDEYDERYKSWRTDDLPIIPRQWKLFVAKGCEKQFAIVKGLIAKADEIVHAGDPDREGQLLVDEVLDYIGTDKPVKRILLNALDEKSIKKANESLRENKEFFPLKQSALARARADWLIGMNLSRAYTLAARRAGHDKLVLPIGRVKTPTLALVVRREREIEHFKPVNHYAIKGEFEHGNGRFTAQWKPREDQPGLDSENRLLDKGIAEEKLRFFLEGPREGVISSYQKAKKQEPPPLPFSLSSLQVMAGKRYGYEPQQVLDTAQALYEKKLTTYPRSDCEYLPLNQFSEAAVILGRLSASGDEELVAWAAKADRTLKSRAWNDKKISAHHAIIPTTVQVKTDSLKPMERNIYNLIARGYIAQFYPLHLYDQTKVEVSYKGEIFTAAGRVERQLGWKELYAAPAKKQQDVEDDGTEEAEEEGSLPAMKKQDAVEYRDGKLVERVTKPPVRFSPSTLLAGMKEIHKYVKNPEAKKQLKEVYGIGTEATRATIIEDLIKRGFLQPKGKKKYLSPTPEAYLLVDVLPDEMTYPDSTAIWEDRLHSMSEGEGSLEDFLKGQMEFTRLLCDKALEVRIEPNGEHKCPRCGKGILMKRHGRNGDFWGCSNYPRCRMSCDDKNGKPDLDGAASRRKTFTTKPGKAPNTSGGGAVSWQPAYPTEEEMLEFQAQHEPVLSARALIASQAAGHQATRPEKPKPSARPMERMAKEEQSKKTGILCPRCREGSLRLIKGRNGSFWGCSNYPRCTATFDDDKGPVLN
ncbi:MAG: DNA topoisomerase 3 [Selenomonadaceae bacterium]|nr:DNA topoisomerase 3 [Selenomonadaceae bacterium]